MEKVLVNGEEVQPGRKVKLHQHLTRAQIEAAIAHARTLQEPECIPTTPK